MNKIAFLTHWASWAPSIALGLAALGLVVLPGRALIDSPRLGQPVLGREFPLTLRTSHPFHRPNLQLRGMGKLIPIRLEKERVLGTHREIRVHLPETMAAGSYQWTSSYLVDEPWVGLHPVPKWGKDLCLVHAADFPGLARKELLVQFVDEMLQLRPQVILFSGDLAYDGQESWYAFLREQFLRLEEAGMPVISCPGNHERAGWYRYLENFGSRTYHRHDLGALTVLSLDSAHGKDALTPSQFRWLLQQTKELAHRRILLQIHHPLFGPGEAKFGDAEKSGGRLFGFRKALLDLMGQYPVEAVLSGHWHQDAVFDAQGRFRDDRADFPGPKFIVTTALGDGVRRITRWPQRYNGYRILYFHDGILQRYTYGLDSNGKPAPIASHPLSNRGTRP